MNRVHFLVLSTVLTGSLAAQPLLRSYYQRTLPQQPQFLAIAAFDADGNGTADLVIRRNRGPSTDPSLTILPNDGTGVFGAPVWTGTGPGIGLQSLLPADIDGDGDLDLISDDVSHVLRNDGNGNFVSVPSGVPGPRLLVGLRVGDLDGDGDVDIAAAGGSSFNALFLNDGTGRFVDASQAWAPDNQITGGVTLADVDGDGDLDALFAGAGSMRPGFSANGFLRVLRNDGGGSFTDLTSLQPALPGLFTTTLVTGDLDGDGDQDLVIEEATQTRVLLNDGTGVFQDRPDLLPIPNLGLSLRLVDLDDDGRPELLGGVTSALNVYAFDPVSGFRLLAPDTLPSVDPGPFPVPLFSRIVDADFDEDGDRDLFVAISPLFAASNFEVWYGLSRQIDAMDFPRIGQRFDFDLSVGDGSDSGPRIALPAIGFARSRLPVPGIGVVGIDLFQSEALPAALFTIGQTIGSGHIDVPADIQLIGLDIFLQSLVVGGDGASLVTNVWPTRIGG